MKRYSKKNSSPMLPVSITKVTFFSRFLVLFLFILLPLAGFYIGVYYQQIFDSQAQAVEAFSSSKHVAPHVVITQKDNGNTITVPVGTTIIVSSHNGLQWDALVSNPTILKKVNASSLQVLAIKTGVATLSIQSKQTCAAGNFCPQNILMFRVKVIVQ